MNSGGGMFAPMLVRAEPEGSQCKSAISAMSVIYVPIRGWECRNVVSKDMNGGRDSQIRGHGESKWYIIRQKDCIYSGGYHKH